MQNPTDADYPNTSSLVQLVRILAEYSGFTKNVKQFSENGSARFVGIHVFAHLLRGCTYPVPRGRGAKSKKMRFRQERENSRGDAAHRNHREQVSGQRGRQIGSSILAGDLIFGAKSRPLACFPYSPPPDTVECAGRQIERRRTQHGSRTRLPRLRQTTSRCDGPRFGGVLPLGSPSSGPAERGPDGRRSG